MVVTFSELVRHKVVMNIFQTDLPSNCFAMAVLSCKSLVLVIIIMIIVVPITLDSDFTFWRDNHKLIYILEWPYWFKIFN